MASRAPSLDLAEIVACALDIVRGAGVDGLTMRVLADRLGVSVAAAYRHVTDKPTLLRLAADELFALVELEGDPDADWVARVRDLMVRFYDVLSAYPGMSGYLALRPEEIPRRNLSSTMRDVLVDAGFPEQQAWDCLLTLVFYCSGALDGPLSRPDLGGPGVEVIRAAYVRGLDRILDGFVVERSRLGTA